MDSNPRPFMTNVFVCVYERRGEEEEREGERKRERKREREREKGK